MDHQAMSEWLANEDEKNFPDRLERLKFIVSLAIPGEYQQFYGGIITKESFEEAKWCYINASFIACIGLCQITLEHSLSVNTPLFLQPLLRVFRSFSILLWGHFSQRIMRSFCIVFNHPTISFFPNFA